MSHYIDFTFILVFLKRKKSDINKKESPQTICPRKQPTSRLKTKLPFDRLTNLRFAYGLSNFGQFRHVCYLKLLFVSTSVRDYVLVDTAHKMGGRSHN